VALRRKIKDLEAELERKEKRLQTVIERYERLLSEKNQQIANQAQSAAQSER
jgi:hypothetical protein